MELYFITGNKDKFAEVQAIIPEVQQLDIDLPEIQGIDPHAVLSAKLKEAQKHHQGRFIVEDNSFVIKGMNGLPGPLIKWFLKTIGNEGLVKLTEKFGVEAEAKIIIGYSDTEKIDGENSMEFFEGTIEGQIVSPRGDNGFGWDPIFLPNGYNKTFGELSLSEKNEFSSRRIAVEKLKDFLNK